MSNDKIRKGLKQFQDSSATSTAELPTVGKLVSMAGLNTNLTTIKEMRVATKRDRDRLSHIRKGVLDEIEKKSERIKREHDDMGWTPDEKGRGRVDQLGADRRRKLRDSALKQMRKAVLSNSTDEVAKIRGDIAERRDKLKLLHEAWASPLVVLNRTTLKSQDRATATANLVGQGAYAIDLAAAEAIRTGDGALGMAVCVAMDGLNKEQKSLLRYSKNEIAATLTFKDFSDAYESLEMSRYFLDASDLAANEIVGGPVTSKEKIRVGLIKESLAANLGKPVEDLDTDPNRPPVETLEHTGQVSISESNRRWFASHGGDDDG